MTSFIINKKVWTITQDDKGKLQDISISLKKAEYQSVIRKLYDPKDTFENRDCVDLLLGGLAKARGEACIDVNEHQVDDPKWKQATLMTRFLDEFEKKLIIPHLVDLNALLVSSLDETPDKTIADLSEKLVAYKEIVKNNNAYFSHWINQQELTPHQKTLMLEDLKQMSEALFESSKQFQQQIQALKKPASFQTLHFLLSSQDRDPKNGTPSLGQFLATQCDAISYAGELMTGHIHNMYLLDLVKKNHITATFIATQSKIRLKNEALYGAEHVDTHTSRNNIVPKKLPEEGDFSILPYLADNTPAELDRVICLLSDVKLSQCSLSMMSGQGVVGSVQRVEYYVMRLINLLTNNFIAPVAEIGVSAVHLGGVTGLYFPALAIDYWFNTALTSQLVKGASRVHDTYSPAKAAITWWNSQYQRYQSDGSPVEEGDHHQSLINAYKDTLNHSWYVDLLTDYSPGNVVSAIGRNMSLLVSKMAKAYTQFEFTPQRAKSDKDALEAYINKAETLNLSNQAFHLEKKNAVCDVKLTEFPKPEQHEGYQVSSPMAPIKHIIKLFAEDVVTHFTDTLPGPAAFSFVMSASSLGSNVLLFAPPSMLQIIAQAQAAIGHVMTGYSGTQAGAHGISNAILQWKLMTVTAASILEASDQNSALIEQFASHPEQTLTAFIALASAGLYIGHLDPIPEKYLLGGKNTYGGFINAIIEEAKVASEGELGAPEECLIAAKTYLIFVNLVQSGRKTHREDSELTKLLAKCHKQHIFEGESKKKADQFKSILDEMGINELTKQGYIDLFDAAVKTASMPNPPVNSASNHLLTPAENLRKALDVLSDPDAPPFKNKAQAIQAYNHLSALIDAFNKDKKPEDAYFFPKKDILHAFRKKHCASALDYPILRQLSFYPGFPLRYIAREVRLGNEGIFFMVLKHLPTAFDRDSVMASREKDVVLRHQWTAMFTISFRAAANLITKPLKFALGVPMLVGLVLIGGFIQLEKRTRSWITGQPFIAPKEREWGHLKSNLERLGRALNAVNLTNFKLFFLDSKKPWLRSRVGAAAHEANNYNDLAGECKKGGKWLDAIVASHGEARHSRDSGSTQQILSEMKLNKKLNNNDLKNTTTPRKPPLTVGVLTVAPKKCIETQDDSDELTTAPIIMDKRT